MTRQRLADADRRAATLAVAPAGPLRTADAVGGSSSAGAVVVAITSTVAAGSWASSTKTLTPDTSGPFSCQRMRRSTAGSNPTWAPDGTTVTCEAAFSTGITVTADKARLMVAVLIDSVYVITNVDCGEVDWPAT